MARFFRSFFGPRVPFPELLRRWHRYLIPTALLLVAAGILLASFERPYWRMTLNAPQYPGGLHVEAYLDRLEGDVAEIDGLNHYIGMRPLNEAAQLEREISWMALVAMAGLLVAAVFIHSRWAALFVIPAILFPAGFLADLHLWLRHFGQNLDPTAALSSSIKPFTPPVLGTGYVGQFSTTAYAGPGLWMAAAASLVLVVALYFHRRAYKPLAEARRRERRAARGAKVSARGAMAGTVARDAAEVTS